jgi:hypothetical protein
VLVAAPFGGTLANPGSGVPGAHRKALSLDTQPLTAAVCPWGHSELLEQAEVIPLGPDLSHLAILQTSDRDPRDLAAPARRQQALKLAPVGALRMPALYDLVALSEEIVDAEHQIRECAPVHGDRLL